MMRIDDASERATGPLHADGTVQDGPVLSTLAPILETDDIVIDAGEQQSSSLVAGVGAEGGDPSPSSEDNGVTTVPTFQCHQVRRPSVIASTMVATRRSVERQVEQRISWSGFVHRISSAVSSIGKKHAKTSPEVIRAMRPRARMHFYLSQPEESQLGWLLHHVMMILLIVNVAIMAAETLDGPRFAGSEPAYPYMPGDAFFLAAENGFTVIYIIDFVLRVGAATNQKLFWKSRMTWVKVIAFLPALIYQGYHVMKKDDPSFDPIAVRASINYLRIARLFRIIAMSRVYVGCKVMFRATKASVAPLKITMFFLITVVMVFATAIFYAEPCYDLKTCTFTDIFNAGYFVMVTVATVGYGSQVPSLYNGGSLILTTIVMIFGSLYLAMPLAIVGIRYDGAWREYEQKKREASKAKELQGLQHVSNIAAVADAGIFRRQSEHQKRAGHEAVDVTLEPLESRKVYTTSYKICDRFYDISEKIGSVHELVQSIFDESSTRSTPSQSPRSSLTVAGAKTTSFSEEKVDAAQLQSAKMRNETTVRVHERIMAVLKAHKKICAEIRALLPAVDQIKSNTNLVRASSGTLSMTRRDGSFSKTATFATGVFGRARRALNIASRTTSQRFEHTGPPTWRSKTWNLLEHNDLSRPAKFINRIRLYLVVLSIALFYAQTTPELQATGMNTSLCRRSIEDFCHSSSPGFGTQPGCFELDSTGKPTPALLDFNCDDTSSAPSCYAMGYNYGSNQFPLTCTQAFGRKGLQRICNNRLCKPPVSLFLDMESKWIFFEFFFGILFTVEMVLRVVVHPDPKKVYRDLTFLIDIVALFPFYVEAGEIIGGRIPMYSVVPTAPSFFAVIRVLKTFRVLKLGTHISGSEVLARTALLVYRRLKIPVFFLFIGSVICGAIFYELERGAECFVGQECIWWTKNVLTPAIAKGLPDGKRIMVQNEHPSLMYDMLRSTWFSIVTMTTVGYGDMRPRTSLGRFFDILTMIMSVCYTAMPLTLVGGQFYVCYEVHLRDKRRKNASNTVVEPKPSARSDEQSGDAASATSRAVTTKVIEHREPALLSLAGLSDEPIIPGLNAPINSQAAPAQSAMATGPVLASRRDRAGSGLSKEPKRPVISSEEMQILNQFILIHKVLNQVVEDLSQLNKLGSQRIALKKDKTDEIASLRHTEAEIETKIADNLVFCATVFLNFAPVIERILGMHDHKTKANAMAMPSILHSTTGGGGVVALMGGDVAQSP